MGLRFMKTRPEKLWWKSFIKWLIVIVILFSALILTRGIIENVNAVSLSVQSILGDTLDLGSYSGLKSELSSGFSGKIFNPDRLLASVKKSEFYDDRLFFEKDDGSKLLYIIKNDSVFSLQIDGYQVEFKALAAVYSQKAVFCIVDAYGDSYRSPYGYQPGEWRDDDINMRDILYLYSQMSPDLYMVKNDSVYLKGYSLLHPEQRNPTDDYVFRVFENNGRICVELLGNSTNE